MVQTGQCDCGTFAIGVCASCGRAVCGDHSRLFDGKRLCTVDHSAAVAEKDRQIAASQLTIPDYLSAAASVGNPGLRSWRIYGLRKVAATKRRGLRKVKYTRSEQVNLGTIEGWLYPGTSIADGGSLVLDTVGGLHRASWLSGGGDKGPAQKKHTWATLTAIPESKVIRNWGNNLMPSHPVAQPHNIDQALRALARENEIPIG